MLADLFHYDERPVKRGRGFFLWSILLLLLTGAALASWILSFYIVGHPEEPRCHRILKKFNKLAPPRQFAVPAIPASSGVAAVPAVPAPPGKFLTAPLLLEEYGKLGPAELARRNAELLRAFLMNYRETKEKVAYVAGNFDIVDTYPLTQGDMFRGGAVALAQSVEFPQLLIEIVFSAKPGAVRDIRGSLPVGCGLRLERSRDLLALLHAARLADGRMQFTLVPLAYGRWQLKNGSGGFSLTSPKDLEEFDAKLAFNIEGTLPLVDAARVKKGIDVYQDFRRKALASAAPDDEAALAGPELVRFDARQTPTPAPKPPPDTRPAAVAPRVLPTPAPSVPLAPRPIVRAPPRPAPTPVPTPPPAPERRPLGTSEASKLVDSYPAEAPALLTGEFVVTGVSGRRVAMRTRESLRDASADPTKPGTTAALIVVDFPEGIAPPAKDALVSRDAGNGFPIRDVIRGPKGQITIVAESGR